MARQTKTVEILGHTYNLCQMGGREGMKVQARLLALLGPLLGGLAGAAGVGSSGASSAQGNDLPVALTALAGLNPDEFLSLATRLLAEQQRDNRLIDNAVFDEVYAGNYAELYKALLEVIDFNFGSLFGGSGISGLAASLLKKAGKPPMSASSIPTSPPKGQSGDS